jgi:Ca2+-binding EF-hand superfamily protein
MREEHQDDVRRWRQPPTENPAPIEPMSAFECSRSKFDAWQADEPLFQDSNVFQNDQSFPFHERSRRREIRQAREERRDKKAGARKVFANIAPEVFDHDAPWAYTTKDSSGQWEPEPAAIIKPLQCKLQRADSWHAFDKETKRRIQLRRVDEMRFQTTQRAGQNPSSGLSNIFVGSITKLLGQLASAVANNRLFDETVKVSLLQTMQQQAESASKEIREQEIKSDAQIALRCDLAHQSVEWALRRGMCTGHLEPIHTTGGNGGRTRVLTTLADTTAAMSESSLLDILLDASSPASQMDRGMNCGMNCSMNTTSNGSVWAALDTSATLGSSTSLDASTALDSSAALELSVLKSKISATHARIKAKAMLRATGGLPDAGRDVNGTSTCRSAEDTLNQAPAAWLRVRHVVAHCALRQSLCTGETCVASLRQLWRAAMEAVETKEGANGDGITASPAHARATTTSGMVIDADPPSAGVLLNLATGSSLMKALPLPLPQLVQLVEAEAHKSRHWLTKGWIPSAAKIVSTHLLPIRTAEGETACELWSAGMQGLVARDELEATGKAKAAEAEASDVIGRRVKEAMAQEGGMRASMHARAQQEEEEEEEEEQAEAIKLEALAKQAEAFARKHAHTKRSSIVLKRINTDVALKKMSPEQDVPGGGASRRQRSLPLKGDNRRSSKAHNRRSQKVQRAVLGGVPTPSLSGFAVGDLVQVTKTGTFHDAMAEIINPEWEGRVQVKMVSDGAVKSYMDIEILKIQEAAKSGNDGDELCNSMLFGDLVELYEEEERLNRKVVGAHSFHAFPLHSQQQHLQQQASRRRRKQRSQKQYQQQQGPLQKQEPKKRLEKRNPGEKIHDQKHQSREEHMLKRAGLSIEQVNGYVAQLGGMGGLGRRYKKDVPVHTGGLDTNDTDDDGGSAGGVMLLQAALLERQHTDGADTSGDHEPDAIEEMGGGLAGELGAGADANLAVCGAVMMVQLMELQQRSAVHLTNFANRVAGNVISSSESATCSRETVTTDGSAITAAGTNICQWVLSSKQSTGLSRLFDRVDKNHDGCIDKRELILALRQNNAESAELRQLLRLPQYIRQTDGSLELFESFFQELDVDNDRLLSCAELMSFFEKSGEAKVSRPSSGKLLSIEAGMAANVPAEPSVATVGSGASKSASSGRHFSPNAAEDGCGECVVTLSVVYNATKDNSDGCDYIATGTMATSMATSSAPAALGHDLSPFMLSPPLGEVEKSMERVVSLMVGSSEAVPRVDASIVPPLPLCRVSNTPLVADPLGSWADSARTQLLEAARSCYKNPAMQQAMSQLLGRFSGLMNGEEVRRIEGVIAKVLAGGKSVLEMEKGGVSSQQQQKKVTSPTNRRNQTKGPKALTVASSLNLLRAEIQRLSSIEDEINRTVPEKRHFAFFELDFGEMKKELVRRTKWLRTEMVEAAERRQYEQIEVARLKLMRADVLIDQVAEIVARKFVQTEEEMQEQQDVGTRERSNSTTRHIQRKLRRSLTTEELNEKVDKSIEAGELLVALDICLFREIVPRAAALLELGDSIRGFKELRAHIELFAAIKRRRDELI